MVKSRLLKKIMLPIIILSSFVSTATYAAEPVTSQVVLKATHQAVLSSQITGKIDNIPLSEGDQFKKGDRLVIFDCTVHEAQYEKAKALLEAKQIAHDSNLKLHKAKAISYSEVARSKSELVDGSADAKIKKHTVDMCYIVAPFDGRLVKKHVHAHETVRQGEPLVEVLDNSHFNIELIVPSSWLSWLKPGEPFKLFIEETNLEYQAHVTKILPRVDAVSQSVRLLGGLDYKYKELISGMSGRARFHKRAGI